MKEKPVKNRSQVSTKHEIQLQIGWYSGGHPSLYNRSVPVVASWRQEGELDLISVASAICKQSAKGFILNCTLPHFYLRDNVAQTVATNDVLHNFIGCITPLLGTSIYFYRAGLTDHHFRCFTCCGRDAAKAAIHIAVPFKFNFSATSHTPFKMTDCFESILLKCIGRYNRLHRMVSPFWAKDCFTSPSLSITFSSAGLESFPFPPYALPPPLAIRNDFIISCFE